VCSFLRVAETLIIDVGKYLEQIVGTDDPQEQT
jgi:hypothetical protein